MELMNDLSVSNIFIYVGDAVRWDSLPPRLKRKGVVAKTAASSIHTPTSFPSIVSGLHPPQHGCWDFSYQLDEDTPTLLNLPGYSTGFANSVNEKFRPTPEMDFVLDKVLNTSLSSYERIGDIEPPFIFLERGPGGHSPYGEYDGNGWEYYRERAGASTMRYVNEYRDGVDRDVSHFESQVQVLEERGLLEDTLIIYTSDHGELLGEGGCLGHNEPIHPMHVYVPTVFIHPDLEARTYDGLFRHIDLFPTINALLDEDVGRFPGRDLTSEEPADRAVCYYVREVASGIPGISGTLDYESVWGLNGGYVFPKNGRINRTTILLGKLVRGAKREYMRRHLISALLHYNAGDRVYGVPRFTAEGAKNTLEEVDSLDQLRTTRTSLSDGEKEHLRELGYLE